MNRVLSLLLLVPFLITQVLNVAPAWARGGPFDDMLSRSLPALAGTYGVSLAGTGPNATSATGVLALTLPAVGIATGRALLFNAGRMYIGTAQGLLDPRTGKLALLSQLSHYFVRTATDVTTQISSVIVDSIYSGQIDLNLSVDDLTGLVEAVGSAVYLEYNPMIGTTTQQTVSTTPTATTATNASKNSTLTDATTASSNGSTNATTIATANGSTTASSNGSTAAQSDGLTTATSTSASPTTAASATNATTTRAANGTTTGATNATTTSTITDATNGTTTGATKTVNGGSIVAATTSQTNTETGSTVKNTYDTKRQFDTPVDHKMDLIMTASGVRQSTETPNIGAFVAPTVATSFQVEAPAGVATRQ